MEVLADAEPKHMTADDIYRALVGGDEDIGLATVYRALQEMAAGGDLDTVRNATGEVLYRQCEQPAHHHHLVCRRCGRTRMEEVIQTAGARSLGA